MFLYAKGSNARITIPARSIDDIKLSEESYKADFELSKRYQDFAKDIIKLSLLGIAGYGFLIEHVVGTEHLARITRFTTLIPIIVGILSLVLSAGVGLYCGQLDRVCLRMQVDILRLLQRTSAARWTNPEDVKGNECDLGAFRWCQAKNLGRAHFMRRVAVWFLILGVVATAVVFILCLYDARPAFIQDIL